MGQRLDDINRTLLHELSVDSRQTVRALAKKVGLSEPAVAERLQTLRRQEVITGYGAVLDPRAVGAGTAAFVALRFDPGEDAKKIVNGALEAEPFVLEVHEVAGEDCYWLKVRVESTDALAIALDRIRNIPTVTGTSTTIVLRTVFERPISVGFDSVPE